MQGEPRSTGGGRRHNPWERLHGVAAALALAALALILRKPPAVDVVISARACDFAVEFAGMVRCEGAVAPTLEGFCGPFRPVSVERLRSGDAIDHALCSTAAPIRGSPGWQRMAPERLSILSLPVNVNEASAAELASLPGIGPVLAARVIEGRPYAELTALRRVRGIGAKKMARLRERARARWPGDG